MTSATKSPGRTGSNPLSTGGAFLLIAVTAFVLWPKAHKTAEPSRQQPTASVSPSPGGNYLQIHLKGPKGATAVVTFQFEPKNRNVFTPASLPTRSITLASEDTIIQVIHFKRAKGVNVVRLTATFTRPEGYTGDFECYINEYLEGRTPFETVSFDSTAKHKEIKHIVTGTRVVPN